jgi:putative hydrolase of the HAD superfamily
MQITTIFFDLDDTLYPSSSGLWKDIKGRINQYMCEQLGMSQEEAARLREKYFQQYGTTMRGLQAHHAIDVQEFLAYVHDLPLKEYLTPDPAQREVIAALPTRNLIFTNADAPHAKRVLTVLGLDEFFPILVDVHAVAPYCKPMPESFAAAMKAAGEMDPGHCLMIDDLPRTTRAAREAGMFSILYGSKPADGDAHAGLTDWKELPRLLETLV